MSMFIKFMRKHKEFDTCNYQFKLIDDSHAKVKRLNSNKCIVAENENDVLDWVYENDWDDLRICTACGCPMDEGWTDDYGTAYFCSKDEFVANMNRAYGEGKWREEPTGEEDWCFEYLNTDGKWMPEASYWTQWI